ncbi:tRNA dimethylallyltransferase [Homalodisca vitripennis]|nr:tRNA dimethylallyltransferase [Homalodisca vitripennis]
MAQRGGIPPPSAMEWLGEIPSELITPVYTLGIFQSIGFKEFHDYLMLSEEQRETEEGRKLFEKGVELMKVATRQYARRQIKWIRQRFLGRGDSQGLMKVATRQYARRQIKWIRRDSWAEETHRLGTHESGHPTVCEEADQVDPQRFLGRGDSQETVCERDRTHEVDHTTVCEMTEQVIHQMLLGRGSHSSLEISMDLSHCEECRICGEAEESVGFILLECLAICVPQQGKCV